MTDRLILVLDEGTTSTRAMLFSADGQVQGALLRAYGRRNHAIQAYFRLRPADLLVIDLSQQMDVAAIVRFLGFPSWINFPMPHLNAAGGQQRPVAGLPPLHLTP